MGSQHALIDPANPDINHGSVEPFALVNRKTSNQLIIIEGKPKTIE
jgi:hypothetical protein